MENLFIDIFAAFWRLLSVLIRAFSPLIIGLVLAYLLNTPTEWIRTKLFAGGDELLLSQRPRGRTVSIAITYLLAILTVSMMLYAFLILILGSLPEDNLYETVLSVSDYFDSVSSAIRIFIEKYLPVNSSDAEFNPASLFASHFEKYFSPSRLLSALSSFIGGAANVIIGFVASIYLLRDKELFISLWQKLLCLILRQDIHGKVNETLTEIHRVLTTFIKGALVDSLIVALLSSFALSVLNVNFAVAIGIIGGLLNIVPYFGPFFGMVPAFLVALFSDGIVKALFAVLALLLIQQLDSNYIYPKVVGSSVGLHPLFVLIALTVFGYFGGIAGMLLAVPIAGIIQIFVKKWAYRF